MPTSMYSTDKDFNRFIAGLVRTGWTFQPKGHRKHAKLIAPNGRSLTIAGSPSDWRALRNLRRDTEYLAALPSTPAKAR